MQPLADIKVVDLTHALAGPFCTYQLHLLGAEVIKIENPHGGDDFRGYQKATFDAVNAGKASVSLNLKAPAALAVVERLVRSADVLVDNFKPGTADRFGLSWDTVRGWNPQVIWCSISGFGLQGPWRDLPAVEWSVQAASGMSDAYLGEDADPRDLGLGVLDLSTGHAAATAILAALLQRAKTGTGQRLDVAMLDVALSLMTTRIASAAAGRGRERRPAVGRFRAKDRRLFLMGAHQRWFKAISDHLGAPFLADDPRFADPEARAANAPALLSALEARLQERTADQWAEGLLQAGVPAAPVRGLGETLQSPHLAQRGVLRTAKAAGQADPVMVLGSPYAPEAEIGTVPALGADTLRILAAHGFGPGEVEDLRRGGAL